jgi:hypothetical protein
MHRVSHGRRLPSELTAFKVATAWRRLARITMEQEMQLPAEQKSDRQSN